MIRKNLLLLLSLALTIQPALSADQSSLFDDAQFFKQWIVKKTKGQPLTPQENKRATKIGKKISIATAIALTAIAAGIAISCTIPKIVPDNQKNPEEPDPLFTQLQTLDKQHELTIEKLKDFIRANPDLIRAIADDGETFMLGFLRVSSESEDNKLELLQFAVEQKLDLSLAPYLDQAIKKGYQKIADYLKQKGLH